MEQQPEQSLFDMNMDSNTQSHLLSISKWTKFISITGFVVGAIVLLALAVLGARVADQLSTLFSLGNSDMAGLLIVMLLVVLLLVGFWLFFLFRASTLLKRGLESKDTIILADGFKAMKSFFIFSFIISILSLLSTLQTIM